MTDLIEQLEAASGPDNTLDVLVEVAMFHPDRVYLACRPNNAGTKVIYTDRSGSQVTCWAQEWSCEPMRTAALNALRAIAALRAREADRG